MPSSNSTTCSIGALRRSTVSAIGDRHNQPTRAARGISTSQAGAIADPASISGFDRLPALPSTLAARAPVSCEKPTTTPPITRVTIPQRRSDLHPSRARKGGLRVPESGTTQKTIRFRGAIHAHP
jgi:hypothetical protein